MPVKPLHNLMGRLKLIFLQPHSVLKRGSPITGLGYHRQSALHFSIRLSAQENRTVRGWASLSRVKLFRITRVPSRLNSPHRKGQLFLLSCLVTLPSNFLP